MSLRHWRAIQAKTVCVLDVDIQNGADKVVVAFEESAEEVEGHYFYIGGEEYRVIRLDSIILSFPHE